MIRVDVTKDDKALKAFRASFTKNIGQSLEVGFFEEDVYPDPDGTQVAQVAQWNNEGSITNPPRPFFTSSVIAPLERKQFAKLFNDSINRIISGKSNFTKEYSIIGRRLQSVIQQSIRDWDTPPNSPRTIADKGFNNPLQDTDLMFNSVDYKIKKAGE